MFVNLKFDIRQFGDKCLETSARCLRPLGFINNARCAVPEQSCLKKLRRPNSFKAAVALKTTPKPHHKRQPINKALDFSTYTNFFSSFHFKRLRTELNCTTLSSGFTIVLLASAWEYVKVVLDVCNTLTSFNQRTSALADTIGSKNMPLSFRRSTSAPNSPCRYFLNPSHSIHCQRSTYSNKSTSNSNRESSHNSTCLVFGLPTPRCNLSQGFPINIWSK